MKKRILALLLALSLVFALVACGGADEDTPSSDSGNVETPNDTANPSENGGNSDTAPESGAVEGAAGLGGQGEKVDKAEHVYTELTIGSLSSKFIGHFDATSGFSTDVGGSCMTLLFDRLFFINPDNGEWTSEVLSDYSIDEDNVAHVTIKEGVVFNRTGDQLLAEDLLYSFERNALSPLNAANWAKYTDLESATISDDGLTLNIPFNMPFGAWQYQLSAGGILEKSWIEENGGEENFDWFDPELANGTGPYIATEYEIGVSTVYEKVDDWWGDDEYCTTAYAYSDKITCLQYTDETTMMVDYENGVLDLALALSTTSMERVINDSSLGTAQSVSSNCVALLVMDFDVSGNPIFENENLRKAICYGADWNALAELGYGVLYSPAESVLPQSSQYCVTGHAYTYDPEYAKQCMEESGLTDVTLTWVVNSGTVAATIAEGFAAYMSEIGITVNLEVYDTLTCISMWETDRSTDFIMVCNNNANASGDPYTLLQYLGNAQSFYCAARMGEEINTLIDNGIYTFDPAVRAEAYSELQDYLYNDYSVVPVCEWNVGLAYHGAVKSTRINDVYQVNLRYIEVG